MPSTMLDRDFTEARKRPVSEQEAIAAIVLDALAAYPTLSAERVAAIRAGIARGRADAAAGRVIDADQLEAELRVEFGVDAE